MVSKSVMFLDYKVHEEIKNQAKRDFNDRSGNKMMLEADNYLRQAITNFTIAGSNLRKAEDELIRILGKFEKCHQLIKPFPNMAPGIVMTTETV